MACLVVTKKMCCRSCVSSVRTVQLVVWEQQLLTGRECQILRVISERSLLILIERVTSNLTGVELVMMTSLHQVNGLVDVGIREIKAQTRILRSQPEQRLGSQIDEKDPLMSWIPRHATNCVSRYRIMDDGRTPDQHRCGKTWKRPVVEFGESVHFSSW